MTFEESIPIAKQLAENQLKKGFDVEAFLILSSLKQFSVTEDEVPESEVDDKIKVLYTLFIQYIKNRNIDNLRCMLSTLSKIIKELYHTCECEEELTEFKSFLTKFQTI